MREESVHGRYSGDFFFEPEFCAEHAAKHEPIFARVREWCGSDDRLEFDEVVALRAEIERLTEIVREEIDWLKWHKETRRSNTLKRMMEEPIPTN
jgi:hypothetical protein